MKAGLFDQLLSSIDQEFSSGLSGFEKYQDDPVGFGQDILGETYTDDVKTLMESVRDNPVTIAISANGTGKTHGSARVAMWWYKVFSEAQVYTAAAPPESNLKKLLWGEIGSIAEKHPELFESDTLTNLHISRSAQRFVAGVTIPMAGTPQQREAKFAGKHSPHLLFVLDEGDAIPDEVFQGIESCMSGGHARLLVMFNPRAEVGAAYRMIRDNKANVVHLSAFSHPNVVIGQDRIPGAVTREVTVRRINEWTRRLAPGELADSECFELPRFLVGAVAKSQSGQEYPPLVSGFYKIMEPAFSYMVLGQYPALGSTQLISKEWIARARARWDIWVAEHGEKPPEFTYGVIGLDIGEFGSDSNALCVRCGGYVERLVVWGGIDTVATADRALSEYQARKISSVNVDATGVGAGVAPQMQRAGCPSNGVKVASAPTKKTELGEFQILRDQLWWACREWLRVDPGAMLPPDEMLIEELAVPTYEVASGKVRIMRKDLMRELLKRSPDRADALVLTFNEGGFFGDCDLT